MPVINQGLTKLKNNTMINFPKNYISEVMPQCLADNISKAARMHVEALKQTQKLTSPTSFVNKNAKHLIEPIFNVIYKIGSIAMSDECKVTRGDGKEFQSILKALRTEEAKAAINDLKYELNKPHAKRLNIVSNLCEMDLIYNSSEYMNAKDTVLSTLAKLSPEFDPKGGQIYSDSFKTPTITMIDALFDKFRIAKKYSEFE